MTICSSMTLVSPTGSLRFITIPAAADVYFGVIFKGTTDPIIGILIVSNLDVGPVSYTVKKTGYNDSIGITTVVGDTITDVPVYLTQTVLQAGFGATEMLVVAGLAIGAIYMMTRPKTLPTYSEKE